MPKQAYLVLQDGSYYEGEGFGAEGTTYGEVVFNTSMTGYQEMLTDPSYAGQILIPTYPLIGNYGINEEDVESRRIQVAGFGVREHCLEPSHSKSQLTLDEYLRSQGVMGISRIDTRAVTRRLRSKGVMMGMITCEMTPEEALKRLSDTPSYGSQDFVRQVSTSAQYEWDSSNAPSASHPIVVLDCGLKFNILRLLKRMGYKPIAVPANTSAEDILSLKPRGIVLSPGPGDPAQLGYAVETIKRLAKVKPIMGICLGHQLLARAFDGETFKLKFGHRGGNHPVRDLATGRVYITAQNHGYAVDPDTLPSELEVSHINLNDNTVEGLRHRSLPIFSIQYHSEASPGPMDNVYLFQKFLEMVTSAEGGKPS